MPLARTDSAVYSFGSATTDFGGVDEDDDDDHHGRCGMIDAGMPTTEVYQMNGQLLELPKAGQGTVAAWNMAAPKLYLANECEDDVAPACIPSALDAGELRDGAPMAVTVRAPTDISGANPAAHTVFFEPHSASSIVGEGGYGRVFLAFDEKQRYALKVIRHVTNKHAHDAAVNEAKLLATVKHVNLLHFYGAAWLAADTYAILTELAVGNVKDLLLRRNGRERASVSETLRVFDGVASALHALHTAGYVHRDVKPDNILLRNDGTVILADVGCACALGFGGKVTGTPQYMPPEAFTRSAPTATAAWDVWALGCVLVELLSGEAPWAHRGLGSGCVVALAAHLRRESSEGRNLLPFSDSALGCLPPELQRLARACLSPSPHDRPTASGVLDAVRRLVSWHDP